MNNSRKYYLIACGTKDYDYKDYYPDLPSVENDLHRVDELFTRRFGYERILKDKLNINPTKQDITKEFANWLKERPDEDSIVVFYYSGHGEARIDTNGNEHYLMFKDTHPDTFRDSALPTKSLAHPLENDERKISQILYIIDTCNAQAGSIGITNFAENIIIKKSGKTKKLIHVCVIAASLERRDAYPNVFSETLEEILNQWNPQDTNGHIDIKQLVNKIDNKLKISSPNQTVNHRCASTNDQDYFLPFVPKDLQKWKEISSELVDKLWNILTKNHVNSLCLINSFLLANQRSEELAENEVELRQRLNSLATKPVSDQVCSLIAFSQWCINISEPMRNVISEPIWIEEIKNWQTETLECRLNADLAKINSYTYETTNEKFKSIAKSDQLRIQVQIVPKNDNEYWEGDNTGLSIKNKYLLNVNLRMRSKKHPLRHFARDIDVFIENIEGEISTIIKKVQSSLPPETKPEIEIFLPLTLLTKKTLEKIPYRCDGKEKSLGEVYVMFINSYERCFDNDFLDILGDMKTKKQALWNNDGQLGCENYYFGSVPSDGDEIVENFAIAVWSQEVNPPLDESEWKQWPQTIRTLRQEKREITLFWDDLYPKPSKDKLKSQWLER